MNFPAFPHTGEGPEIQEVSMPTVLRWLSRFPASRLSRRIGMWVFLSVILIEAILLIPSYQNRRKELLEQIRSVSEAEVALIMKTMPPQISNQGMLERLRELARHLAVVGGTLYRPDGERVGSFGERPELPPADARRKRIESLLNRDKTRYDVMTRARRPQGEYLLVVRNDVVPVNRKLDEYVLHIVGLVVIISIFVTAGAWLTLGTLVVDPILKLRRDLVSTGRAVSRDEQPAGFFSASYRRRDELGEVIEAFRLMFRQITDAIDRRKHAEEALQRSLHQVEAYSKVLDDELQKGRRIQMNFLPAKLPTVAGWESAAFFKPARQVAGDFYDLFMLPGNNLGVVIADVCDKGVGAALFMALFRSLIRIYSEEATCREGALREKGRGPGMPPSEGVSAENGVQTAALEAVRLTNDYIATHHGDLAMFATLFFGVLDTASGDLSYISGGHDPLPILDAGGGVKAVLKPSGPAVGVAAQIQYERCRIRLAPGDLWLGYTDGVTEALGADGDFYTYRRLLALLSKPAGSAEALIQTVAEDLRAHTADSNQHDDITLLALRRLP